MSIIFTYYLGAGASCKSLPMVKDFNKRLEAYKQVTLKDHSFIDDNHSLGTEIRNEFRIGLISDLEWVIKEISNHASVDTLARKLYLTQDNDRYKLLKFLIGEFLIAEQLFNGIDLRYDAFFAAILELSEDGKITLPRNLRILNWNYDKQVEFSVGQFHPSSENHEVEKFINLFPRIEMTDNLEDFAVFKLNGTIGGIVDKKGFNAWRFDNKTIKDKITAKIKDSIISNTIVRYNKFKNESIKNYQSAIHYSWENEGIVREVRQKALQSTQKTNILVVIGYSFPTFNRELDSKLLNNMADLQKIYIQTPIDSFEGVKQRIKALSNNTIKLIPVLDTDEFYIPFEFTS
jgi:hypothetical protein